MSLKHKTLAKSYKLQSKILTFDFIMDMLGKTTTVDSGVKEKG